MKPRKTVKLYTSFLCVSAESTVAHFVVCSCWLLNKNCHNVSGTQMSLTQGKIGAK